MGGYSIARNRMIKEQIVGRGITSPNVIAAMSKVPRHRFVDRVFWPRAHDDFPLMIAAGQTISQPYIVALMSELLDAKPGMSVLEIGTGCGYQSAVLHEMGLDVYSVERLRELYNSASKLLIELRYNRIRLKLSDGTMGWAEAGPFDRIIVTAGGPSIPEPLIDQLADPGILVIPVGNTKGVQELIVLKKDNGKITQHNHGTVRFVDLVGNHGW